MSTVALDKHLAVFADFFADDDITDIIVNRPGEVWIEKNGQFDVVQRSGLSFDALRGLADLVATHTRQALDAQHPCLSATLPNGSRVQFVIPASCPADHVYLVIRRHRMIDLTLEDYQAAGIFDPVDDLPPSQINPWPELRQMQADHDVAGVIRYAMENRITLLISGATGTGKTALLNTCLKYIPLDERLICIEDSREVKPPQRNVMYLLYSRGNQGLSNVGARELLEASLRLRPDRILFQELRGSEEANAFLRAINSGHHGSIATVHASSSPLAYEQIALMVMQSGIALTLDQIIRYVKGLIPIVLQYDFVNGKRRITEIYIDENR